MCKFIIILFASILSLNMLANSYNTDSALISLDNIIANKDIYETAKKNKINILRRNVKEVTSYQNKYTVYGKLFYEYRTYKLDSAMYYARKRVEVATKMGVQDSIYAAMMNEVDGLKGLGKLKEGIIMLNTIPRTDFVKSSSYFYHMYHSITLALYRSAYYEEELQQYNKMLKCYRDTINMVNERGSAGYIINEGEMLKQKGEYRQAQKIMIDFMARDSINSYGNATFLCSLSDIYEKLGDHDAAKYYLILGSIQDKIKCGKTYTSLQNLALMLYKENDIERAYKYITVSMEDIMACNARSRIFQVAEYMPIINSAYTLQQTIDAKKRAIFTFIIILLMVMLATAMGFLYKRNRALNSIKEALNLKNEELNTLNNSLNNLNKQLHESNKIKEEYIAQLFNICSGYIDSMEKYRLSLSRKMKAGQEAEVAKALNNSQVTENLKDFFQNFDMIFLDLFPNFIESFNKLLQEDAQIITKEGELLTPELRIYALVRLGINDSTKIAGFLHYSPQTVYNYRLKVRNKASVPKEEFVERVQKL